MATSTADTGSGVIDSHCHLADEVFEATLPEVIERARASGVEGALCILDATNTAEAARSTRVASLWPAVRFAVGVHPHQAGVFAERLDDVDAHVRTAVAARAGTCAIGEIGLDYHYDFASPDVQREVFRRQIRVASELDHPIVVHTREADDDTFAILTDDLTPRVSGVFHCFTGSAVAAQRAVDLGFYVSFSGIVTFRSADSIREAAAVVPADRLLIETDSPYLAPVPHRGKQNEPGWVMRVADVVAEVRGVSPAEVRAQTTAAYQALFRPQRTR